MLGVSEPGALNCYNLFRFIQLTASISRNLTLIHFPLSGSPDSLLCDLIVPTPRLVFFLLMSHTLASSSFSSGRTYLSLNFLPTSLSSLDSYSDYVKVNISLNYSFLLSFLNVYAPPIRSSPIDSRTDSISPSIFLLQKSLHFGGLQLPSPSLKLKSYFRPP